MKFARSLFEPLLGLPSVILAGLLVLAESVVCIVSYVLANDLLTLELFYRKLSYVYSCRL